MIFLFLLSILMAYLGVEKILHDRRVRRIPIRIHVNGTRGKSSVVRFLSEVLRGTGIRTMAKTTGTEPTLIYPDGHEERIKRRGPSRIQEQIWFVKKAARLDVEAIVVECMAIEPRLQWTSEVKMIKSTIGVITNVGPDHFEVMGKTLEEIAESLAESIPFRGALVTGDKQFFSFFCEKARRRHTRVYIAEEAESKIQPDQTSSVIQREHLAIVRKVCSLIERIPPDTSERMMKALPKKYGVTVLKRMAFGKTVYWIDAFSANDIHSTKVILKETMSNSSFPRPLVALLNNREDRPLRMLSFLSFLSEEPDYDMVFLVGDLRRLAHRIILKKRSRLPVYLPTSHEPEKLLEEISNQILEPEFTLMGMGNYKALGKRLTDFFRKEGERSC